MIGTLFKYGPGASQLALKSAPPAARSPRGRQPGAGGGEAHLVLVGGLTDGLLFAPYAQQLSAAAGALGWCLVQAQLTSSYQGWGLASLDQDAAELKLLADCLAAQHDCGAWVLMGHSTGCQDAVRYVARHLAQDARLAGVILQAPVSDREYLSTLPAWAERVPLAQQLLQQGKGEDVAFRAMDWDGAAVTARRLVSLCCEGGDDDMFSTDLTPQQLQDVMGPLAAVSCLILQSGEDEAVPEQLRRSGAVAALGQRMLHAMSSGGGAAAQAAAGSSTSREGTAAGTAPVAGSGGSTGVLHQLRVVEGAGHACAGHEQVVVDSVCDFLKQLEGRLLARGM